MRILGIETSCDETAASIVENGTNVLSNIVASSSDIHTKTGGIIPEQAARQQIQSIIPVINQAISEAFGKNDHTLIDSVAITYGPGLIGSLLVGVETAKTLSFLWNKPLIPVNHLVGHIYANWLQEPSESRNAPNFPALALVVSGGHTDLVVMTDHGKLEWLGGTRDDAAGEAFDKTARLLGLPYPGGPSISKEADKYLKGSKVNNKLSKFPRPMIDKDNFDWSFSGLKTAVLREFDSSSDEEVISCFSAEVQEAIVDVLVDKTLKAVSKYKPKSLLLAGGVVANSRLRHKFTQGIEREKIEIELFIPPPKLCTDNAAYIASCAYFNNKPINWSKLSSNPQLSIVGIS